MFDREKAINDLIDDDMNVIKGSDGWMLSDILAHGFKGYNNFTDGELVEELNERFGDK